MKAIVIRSKLDLVETELPTPEPQAGQVRLRMAYGGICGSDLHYYHEGANGSYVVREPLVPGHELSGTVDLDPSGELAPGTPVTIHPATFGTPEPGIEDRPHLWPNGAYLGSASTWPHTQGGMSEFVVVGNHMVRTLPASLPLRRAVLAEPLAVALHAIAIAGGVKDKRVLVSGSGAIGLLTASAALSAGAAEVVTTDVLPGPLQRARDLGVHGTLQVGTDEIPAGYFDVVLECTAVPAAISAALTATRRAGTVVLVGIPADEPRGVNLAPLVARELQLRGTLRFNNEIDEAIQLLATNPALDQVITHEYPADQAVDAFTTAANSNLSGKVLLALWP
ncbi:L-idonate 5-dehydrogenase [Kribbella sp. VKM Ac-2569]|uniref:L-idonate 5-dehydrogenase n=1 Tax=Kribbella sp. VKM Ac-2569 TaxID=2512220 RepID=UPI00102B86E1|nr:L-idonate 5-dehydrogenase [Kribbella sp. VKM Ac-2569]RZT11721.1 L-idonate 5-dehydrogenase [Kribbella sp. VKM Ac-2569]